MEFGKARGMSELEAKNISGLLVINGWRLRQVAGTEKELHRFPTSYCLLREGSL